MLRNHQGYNQMFKKNKLSFGLTIPLENHHKQVPTMDFQIERAQLAEEHNFQALWLQDVLLEDPTFEDPSTGQIFDSFLYAVYLASHTSAIKIGTAATVLPLRHPLRTAKEVASIDRLFPERFLLGVSSGDRRKDFEGLGIPIMERREWFRDAFEMLQISLYEEYPNYQSKFGKMDKSNLVPKPSKQIPILMTGYCQQTLDWVAEHGDGWMFYPQRPEQQRETIHQYREKVSTYHGNEFRPFIMPLPLDLMEDPHYPIEKIPAGYRTGRLGLIKILEKYRIVGVNHIMFGLSQSTREIENVIDEIGNEVIPYFQ
ncbi:TIGR03571 family LLM class oxidoreductase [Halobacillus sp. A1]|uniref:TIGR03571 family LLM class oxidoreductase n=1 Tax=Halobacillus sp. A1 TaxID=2880262 RepID=UPI0020A68389|nr:TIGR03571 family LLM class oxidoreductase [Halobacillus sp. A1]MCP3030207.1 TIGR03571 family LLM class oxidoreductase [Halobacillus sp. A1]